MSVGGSLHGMVHTGGGGGGVGTQARDQHQGFQYDGDGGVRGHGGRGGSGIVLIQTNVAPPNGANTAVVQVGNPRRRSLPPTVSLWDRKLTGSLSSIVRPCLRISYQPIGTRSSWFE